MPEVQNSHLFSGRYRAKASDGLNTLHKQAASASVVHDGGCTTLERVPRHR